MLSKTTSSHTYTDGQRFHEGFHHHLEGLEHILLELSAIHQHMMSRKKQLNTENTYNVIVVLLHYY